MSKVCYKCGKLLIPHEKYTMFPLERPYINLFFHIDCAKEVGDILQFLLSDLNRFYKYVEYSKTTKNRANVVQLKSIEEK